MQSRILDSPRRIAVGVALVVVAVMGALLVPVPFSGRSATALGDLVHAPLFGSLAVAWLWIWERLRPVPIQTADQPTGRLMQQFAIRGLVVWLCLSSFGVAMEFLQSRTGRSGSPHDAIANALGVAAAFFAYLAWRFQEQKSRTFVFGLAAALIILVAWWRPVAILRDMLVMPRQLPLLASFESSAEMTRWAFGGARVNRVSDDRSHGRYALEVEFPGSESAAEGADGQTHSAITLTDFVGAWSEYSAIEIDVLLEPVADESRQFVLIKVIDRHQGDYRVFSARSAILPGQWRRIRIPFSDLRPQQPGTTLQRDAVSYVDIGWRTGQPPTRFRLDRLTLAR